MSESIRRRNALGRLIDVQPHRIEFQAYLLVHHLKLENRPVFSVFNVYIDLAYINAASRAKIKALHRLDQCATHHEAAARNTEAQSSCSSPGLHKKKTPSSMALH